MDLALIRNWFKKKPKQQPDIWQFWSTWPGLDITYPILSTDSIPVPWLGQSRLNLQQQQRDYGAPLTNAAHLCSGIGQYLKQGWIVTSWCDFMITTNGDLTTFEWRLPPRIAAKYPAPIIENFDHSVWGDYANLPPWTLKTLVKYNTPWCFNAPQGWGLQVTPLHYHNESRFTNTVGIIDPARGNQLNAVLLWHQPNGQTLVRAGTPLFHMSPVPLRRPEYTVRTANQQEQDYRLHRDFLISNTFAANTEKTTELYNYYFNRPSDLTHPE